MGIDFEKRSAIDKMIKSESSLSAVIALDISKPMAFYIVGIFASETEAWNAANWLEKNRPLEKGVYLALDGPVKKWKGEQ